MFLNYLNNQYLFLHEINFVKPGLAQMGYHGAGVKLRRCFSPQNLRINSDSPKIGKASKF